MLGVVEADTEDLGRVMQEWGRGMAGIVDEAGEEGRVGVEPGLERGELLGLQEALEGGGPGVLGRWRARRPRSRRRCGGWGQGRGG